MKDFKDSKEFSSIFNLINRLKVFNLFILSAVILILEAQILCRPKVGVDGLYLRYSPTRVPAKQGKIGPIKSSAVILILEAQILRRPKVGVDGLY